MLNISYGTVYQWVKQLGEQHQIKPNDNQEIDVVELDEIHSDTHFKKTTAGHGLPLTDTQNTSYNFVCGKRDTNTFKRLYNQLNPNTIKLFCSDY